MNLTDTTLSIIEKERSTLSKKMRVLDFISSFLVSGRTYGLEYGIDPDNNCINVFVTGVIKDLDLDKFLYVQRIVNDMTYENKPRYGVRITYR